MKKLLAIAALVGGFAASCFASTAYKIDDASVDQMFAQSNDVTMIATSCDDMMNSITTAASTDMAAVTAGGSQSKGGYLLRACFCGWIALHRSYMGASGLWWKYLIVNCVGVGGILVGIDFWWVVFSSSALNKYKGNQKFLVFMGK